MREALRLLGLEAKGFQALESVAPSVILPELCFIDGVQ